MGLRAAGRRPSGSANAVPRHPFAASTKQLAEALGDWMPAGPKHPWMPSGPSRVWMPGEIAGHLPSRDAGPVPSPALSTPERDGQVPVELSTWRLPVLTLDAVAAARVLLTLSAGHVPPALILGDDVRYWISAARFGLDLVCRQRFLPGLVSEDDRLRATWRPLLDQSEDVSHVDRLIASMPAACRTLTQDPASPPPSTRHLLADFLNALVDGIARSAVPGTKSARASRSGRICGRCLVARTLWSVARRFASHRGARLPIAASSVDGWASRRLGRVSRLLPPYPAGAEAD